ncbi:hypothetical protein HK104_000475, partial [Borealophlyctis nickersoniae]
MADIWLLVVKRYLSLSETAALKQTGKPYCLWKKYNDKALLHLPLALPDTQLATLATLLIERGTCFNVNELHRAAILGKTALFQVLLDHEAHDRRDHEWYDRRDQEAYDRDIMRSSKNWHDSALSAAAFGGHNDIVKLLLDHADYFAREDDDESLREARYWAVRNAICNQMESIQLLSHQTEMIEMLSQESSDKVKAIEDVLDVACLAGWVRIVKLALAYAEKVGVNLSLGRPMLRACQCRRHGGLNIVRMFLARGVDPNQTIDNDDDNDTYWFSVSSAHSFTGEWTPMRAALSSNNLPVVKLLLARGANPRTALDWVGVNTDEDERRALDWVGTDVKTLEFLLDRIIPPPAPTSLEQILKRAAVGSETSCFKYILNRYPEHFEHFQPHLSTYLKEAVRKASLNLVKLLLLRGARFEKLKDWHLAECAVKRGGRAVL